MSLRRRTVLTRALGMSTALLGAPLLGAGPATAAGPLDAPTQRFAIGVREFDWNRGGRRLVTRIFYPATGNPGGNPVRDAAIANGVFPVVEFSHGLGGNPESYAPLIRPLAEAGFVVPAPVFPTTSTGTPGNIGDVYNGNQSQDVSEVITRTLALNTTAGSPFAGRLDTATGVGIAGHSLGGMTTHGLLTAWPDERVVAAVPFATVDMGNPSGRPAAKVLFVHGDQDPICQYSSARQAYTELPAPKAFLTHLGTGHDEYIWSGVNHTQTVNTYVDWMRWSLYGDTAARDRLPAGAAGSRTRWESVLTPAESGPAVALRSAANGQYVCAENAGAEALIANRPTVGPWERFELVDAGGGSVALRALVNGQYVCAENAGASPLIANRSAVGPWETFTRINNGDGSISLRAHANDRYVTAGAQPLAAAATTIGSAESFHVSAS
ncbi:MULTISPECIES: alpha/beta hydrolase [unclassified Streptomyces]|uniref:alpha/beta hydrolase n=1 Tax=unclassified Streptomyces TaxID=2593676 RepID=UPI001F21FB5E|nr:MULTISPECIES: mucin-2 [unclassified Streptomyces]MCU4748835.1 mucin-2 [Streptomyces sp. G-5]